MSKQRQSKQVANNESTVDRAWNRLTPHQGFGAPGLWSIWSLEQTHTKSGVLTLDADAAAVAVRLRLMFVRWQEGEPLLLCKSLRPTAKAFDRWP